jgi:hypothetical protein
MLHISLATTVSHAVFRQPFFQNNVLPSKHGAIHAKRLLQNAAKVNIRTPERDVAAFARNTKNGCTPI